jgi:hypothetical protein
MGRMGRMGRMGGMGGMGGNSHNSLPARTQTVLPTVTVKSVKKFQRT